VFVSPFADLFTSRLSPEKAPSSTQPKPSAIPPRLKPTKSKTMPPTRPRSNSESATEAGPAPAAKPHKKKMRKQERRDADAAAAAAALATALANTSPEMEEGELDEGPLFFVDDTPAAVPAGEAFMIDTVGDFPALAERNAPDDDANALGSDEALRIFAGEVQATSDEESSDEEENGVGEQVVFTLDGAERHLASTEADLRRAIEGKIVDDSAAQVTGRYYKEADLTKSCALCGGEQGHVRLVRRSKLTVPSRCNRARTLVKGLHSHAVSMPHQANHISTAVDLNCSLSDVTLAERLTPTTKCATAPSA